MLSVSMVSAAAVQGIASRALMHEVEQRVFQLRRIDHASATARPRRRPPRSIGPTVRARSGPPCPSIEPVQVDRAGVERPAPRERQQARASGAARARRAPCADGDIAVELLDAPLGRAASRSSSSDCR